MSGWGAAVGAIVSLIGSGVQAGATRSAANSQAAAARDATQAQRDIYEQQRTDQLPWTTTGAQAMNALAYQLGLPGYQAPAAINPDPYEALDLGNTYQQIRAELLPSYTRQIQTGGGGDNGDYYRTEIDEAGLNAAVAQRLAAERNAYSQRAAERNALSYRPGQVPRDPNQVRAGPVQRVKEGDVPIEMFPQGPEGPQATGSGGMPGYGSLLRDFQLSDFQQDPGYQFRLQEGEKAINRNAMARGRYSSGSVLKALQDFNSGLASQEFSNSYNRFQQNQGNRFNRLASIAGIGQTSVGQVGQAGQNYANAAGQNALAAGNARAAGTIGTANSINSGIGGAVNWWQGQNALRQNNNNQVWAGGSAPSYGGQPWGGTSTDAWYG